MHLGAEKETQERADHRGCHPGGEKDEAEREQPPRQEARHQPNVTADQERALSEVVTVTRGCLVRVKVEWNTLKSVGLHPVEADQGSS
ncbi:hypothetical protein GCM10010168_39680 [Actinoplanes ianthinogenes]|uniref:Transposase n=1 Tax=Actinoplanes ianthinogenes TaxID=122358 RepID=A0ABN6CF14_9ACTN|nr:hypothetical protein Aiant_43800 [Actinoplanes ianthinogenes]GGR18057.1 hypothetical protein GCM10010168_39680 [Actinoplanes ianthinogenes]